MKWIFFWCFFPILLSGQNSCDWKTEVETYWGAGSPTATKLAIFDEFWNGVDRSYGCFNNLTVDWDELRSTYRPEVAAGVSLGRFAGIMSHLSVALRESKTNIFNRIVSNENAIERCTPVMVVGGWGDNSRFGAALTPLADKSLLVYQTTRDHPLGLKVGDRVLGYNGRPWSELYQELLADQLPITGWWWGSSPSSFEHSFLMSAGLNWHLFDTIDVVKYATGGTVHLATEPLERLIRTGIYATEQLPVPGVPQPNRDSLDFVTYGLIDGTKVGYVYVWAWTLDAEDRFTEAVDFMMREATDGFIMDFRTNYGGNYLLSNPGMSILFDQEVNTFDVALRCNETDRLAMCPDDGVELYRINGNPTTFYDKKIAVLTGPGALGTGEVVARRMIRHPNARLFGKPTAAAFNTTFNYTNLPDVNWDANQARCDFFEVDNPGVFLTHRESPPHEEVWFTPDFVAQGKDNVVEAALDWILDRETSTSTLPGADLEIRLSPNPATLSLQVENIPEAAQEVLIYDSTGLLLRRVELSGEVSTSLNVAELNTGVYLLVLRTPSQMMTAKFIKN